MIVSIDTNILIWGVRKESSREQRDMIPRAIAFLDWLDRHDHTIYVPAICVAEYLVGASKDEVASEMKVLTTKFRIVQFDANAAVIAARIRSDKSFVQSLKETVGKTTVCVKADIMWVATAKAHGVQKIYSHDNNDIPPIALRCDLPHAPLPELTELAPIVSPPHTPRATPRSLLPEDDS